MTHDGALVLACCVDSVLAFSSASGEQLYALQHSAPVTALCAHPQDDALVYSSTAVGHIILWDLTSGNEVQRWQLDNPVESLVVDDAQTGEHTEAPALQLLSYGRTSSAWHNPCSCSCAGQDVS